MATQSDSIKNLKTIVKDFKSVQKSFEKQKSKACEEFSLGLDSFFEEFFNLIPTITSIVWTQYTPHFNDGDVCRFRTNVPVFYNGSKYDEDDFNFSDDEDQGLESWEISTSSLFSAKQKKMVEFFCDLLENNQDFFEEIYGDHCQITVTATGFSNDEYRHD